MAIDSLFDRGTLSDWREFAHALKADDGTIAAEALFMCEHHEDKGSAALARTLVEHFRGALPSEDAASSSAGQHSVVFRRPA